MWKLFLSIASPVCHCFILTRCSAVETDGFRFSFPFRWLEPTNPAIRPSRRRAARLQSSLLVDNPNSFHRKVLAGAAVADKGSRLVVNALQPLPLSPKLHVHFQPTARRTSGGLDDGNQKPATVSQTLQRGHPADESLMRSPNKERPSLTDRRSWNQR
ncbi:hypothetical protein B0J18DRAFT_136077 [Chaetomium sp. MPI-SDFR-AT-0129]|nr:hypothetical protein B0J18DRAFT_136077 [Chaetomium sp. MPI-SDFR-AT-0129]